MFTSTQKAITVCVPYNVHSNCGQQKTITKNGGFNTSKFTLAKVVGNPCTREV